MSETGSRLFFVPLTAHFREYGPNGIDRASLNMESIRIEMPMPKQILDCFPRHLQRRSRPFDCESIWRGQVMKTLVDGDQPVAPIQAIFGAVGECLTVAAKIGQIVSDTIGRPGDGLWSVPFDPACVQDQPPGGGHLDHGNHDMDDVFPRWTLAIDGFDNRQAIEGHRYTGHAREHFECFGNRLLQGEGLGNVSCPGMTAQVSSSDHHVIAVLGQIAETRQPVLERGVAKYGSCCVRIRRHGAMVAHSNANDKAKNGELGNPPTLDPVTIAKRDIDPIGIDSMLTVGHSNQSIGQFTDLLGSVSVTAIADVRTVPRSQWSPHFNREALKTELTRSGIAYVFLGDLLGGRPAAGALYVDGVADYEAMAATPAVADGISRLKRGGETYKIAIMCSEKEPLDCHRCLMVARVLAADGIEMEHLHVDGRVESQQQLEDRLMASIGLEPSMFEGRDETLSQAYRERARRIAYRRDAGAAPKA